MDRIFWFLCCITVTSGCTRIVFNVPQPEGRKTLIAFPESFTGIYSAGEESMDSLIVGNTTVTFIEHSGYEIPLRAIDTMLHITLKDGLLYDAEMMRAEGVPYQIDDSIIRYQYYDRYDVGISDTLVLKESGKYLVVSTNFEDDDLDYWDVVLVRRMNSGNLEISAIGNFKSPGNEDRSGSYDGDLSEFETIAPFEQLAENTFLFKPTPAQFQKLIRKRLFSKKQTYHRID